MAKRSFIKDQSGAVTLDWLVLTVAMVGIGIVILSSISASVFEPDFKAQQEQQQTNG